jgi:YHS domain-containing protein
VDMAQARAAGWVSEYQGKTYYFHSYRCNRQFDKDPASYVGEGVKPPKAEAVAGEGKGSAVSGAMSRDPVCGIEVDEGKARAAGRMSEYQGKTYFFDSDVCKLVFDSDMAKYGGRATETKQIAGAPADPKVLAAPQGMVKDPVCGKVIYEGQAKAAGKTSQYQGKTYFFDSDQCKQKFDKEPEIYVGKGTSAQKESAHPARTRGLTMGMLQDPICGRPVIPGTAKDFGLVSEYRGKTYFFDSIPCKQAFDKEPELYVGKGAGTQKKPAAPTSSEKTLPPGLSRDPVSGLNVDESKAKATGLTSEYQGKTYYFFNIHFKNNFDEEPTRYVSKTAEAPK